MKRYLSLYKTFLAQYLKILMEYRIDFLIGLIGFGIIQLSGIAFLYLIFAEIPNLNGWSFEQIVFIYGFAQIPRGLDHLITDNLWILSKSIIVKGQFDRYLLRPINPLFHLVSEVIQFDAFGELLVGIALVIWSMIKLKITVSFLQILLFILTIISGAVIYTSIKLLFASLSFWIKNSHEILWMNYSLSDFSKYPLSIYSKPIRTIITYIIPFGFTAFIPASYFLNKGNLYTCVFGTFAAAILSFIIAYTIWLNGIKAYESSGS